MYLCTRKDAHMDVLNLPVLRLHRFRSDVVGLVLILRLCLLRYVVEFIQILLPVLLLLMLFVHAITSGIVCAKDKDYMQEKALIEMIHLLSFNLLLKSSLS